MENPIDDVIAKFIGKIQRGPFYIESEKDKSELKSGDFLEASKNKKYKNNIYALAVHQAYLDMNRTNRTVPDGWPEEKRMNLIEKLGVYFSKKPAPKESGDFDAKHREMMSVLDREGFSVGQAQKIINMAFKYLYCCEDLRDAKGGFFDFCHMPLDSFTLNWVKEIFEEKNGKSIPKQLGFNKGSGSEIKPWSEIKWSAISNENGYFELEESIRKYIKNCESDVTVLQAEFYIWETEKNRASAKEARKLLKDLGLSNLNLDKQLSSYLSDCINAPYFGKPGN